MKTIPLTRGHVTIVDDEDYERLAKFKWRLDDGYAVRSEIQESGKMATKRIHRYIIGNVNGAQVDHVNCDKLDNRRANLRPCTHSQNQFNRGRPSNNTSGHKGVTWCSSRGKWQSGIWVSGRYIQIGRFQNIQDAIDAYSNAAKEHAGEFARA